VLAFRGVRVEGAGLGCVSVPTMALGCMMTSDGLNSNLDHFLLDGSLRKMSGTPETCWRTWRNT